MLCLVGSGSDLQHVVPLRESTVTIVPCAPGLGEHSWAEPIF